MMHYSKNKIAFIFAYRNSDVWSTPISVVNEFKSRGWETKIYSLFDYKDNYTDSNISTLIEENKNNVFNPDIVMYMDWGRFDSDLLDKKNIPSAFWIMESGDDPQNFQRNFPKSHKFDLVLTPAHDSYLRYKEHNINAIWWTHFADTNIHKIYNNKIDNLQPVRSTRGIGGSQMMDYLSKIIPEKFINKNGLVGEEYGLFLYNSNIVFQNSRWQEITRRIFEGMACGKMILTDRLPENTHIDDLFIENVDIVYYDNISEAISKINYYLSDIGKAERKKIALNGYYKVINNHTQVQRVDSILKEYYGKN